MTSLVTVFYTTGAAHLKGAVAAEQVHEVTYIQSIQGYTFSSHGHAWIIAPQIPLHWNGNIILDYFKTQVDIFYFAHNMSSFRKRWSHSTIHLSAGRWEESWLGVARSASRRARQWTTVGDRVSIRARVLGQHQHGHAGTHRGRGGCHSADKGTLVDIFNFTLLLSLISFLKMCKTVAFTIILTIFTILRRIYFPFLT